MLKGLKEFASYSKKERRGIYALLLLIALLTGGLYFDEYLYEVSPADQEEFQRLLAFRAKAEQRKDSLIAANLRVFDPNTANIDFLKSIGLSTAAAQSMVNYVQKGGRFRRPDDLLKIYNMDSAWYGRVKTYVQIENKTPDFVRQEFKPEFAFEKFDPNTVTKDELEAMGLRDWQAQNLINYREKYKPFEAVEEIGEVYGLDSSLAIELQNFAEIDSATFGRKAKPKRERILVELNEADSLTLLKVSGIGPYTAGKILFMREELGGFHSHEQLLDIYPIDSVRLKKLKPQLLCNGKVKRLNINTATFDELIKHPYLEYRVVKNILHFRENIRPFNKVSELRNIELVDAPLFRKIAPYLMVEAARPQEN